MAVESKISEYAKIWEQNPTSNVFARLADIHRKSGDINKAIEVCTKGIENNPAYVTGHLILGRCYLERGITDKAQECFEKALGLDRRNLLALKMLGDILISQGRKKDGVGKYAEILFIDPLDSSVHELYERYNGYELLGDPLQVKSLAQKLDQALSMPETEEAKSEVPAPPAGEPVAAAEGASGETMETLPGTPEQTKEETAEEPSDRRQAVDRRRKVRTPVTDLGEEELVIDDALPPPEVGIEEVLYDVGSIDKKESGRSIYKAPEKDTEELLTDAEKEQETQIPAPPPSSQKEVVEEAFGPPPAVQETAQGPVAETADQVETPVEGEPSLSDSLEQSVFAPADEKEPQSGPNEATEANAPEIAGLPGSDLQEESVEVSDHDLAIPSLANLHQDAVPGDSGATPTTEEMLKEIEEKLDQDQEPSLQPPAALPKEEIAAPEGEKGMVSVADDLVIEDTLADDSPADQAKTGEETPGEFYNVTGGSAEKEAVDESLLEGMEQVEMDASLDEAAQDGATSAEKNAADAPFAETKEENKEVAPGGQEKTQEAVAEPPAEEADAGSVASPEQAPETPAQEAPEPAQDKPDLLSGELSNDLVVAGSVGKEEDPLEHQEEAPGEFYNVAGGSAEKDAMEEGALEGMDQVEMEESAPQEAEPSTARQEGDAAVETPVQVAGENAEPPEEETSQDSTDAAAGEEEPPPTRERTRIDIPEEIASPTLAEIFFKQGQRDQAVEVYQYLLSKDPQNPQFQKRLAELQAQAPKMLDETKEDAFPQSREKPLKKSSPKRKKTPDNGRPLSGVRIKKKKEQPGDEKPPSADV